ncbi:MAG: peptidoglycan recognition family protein, partial [Bacillota bacterium]|nr:peptidoglycan recognition family protein [Bacillota bacterium]
MNIQKKLTPYNYTAMKNKSIKYIVIHYVGSVSSAKNNADNLFNHKTSASAHYYVDENEVWQCVNDKDKAWHCGKDYSNGKAKYWNKCTNSNSIGIEMCVKKDKNGNWYFEADTVNNTIELVKSLMNKYKISITNVIRHYDVTGKNCPAPLIDEGKWSEFKERLGDDSMTDAERKEFEELKTAVNVFKEMLEPYHYMTELPEYPDGTGRATIQKLKDRGIY